MVITVSISFRKEDEEEGTTKMVEVDDKTVSKLKELLKKVPNKNAMDIEMGPCDLYSVQIPGWIVSSSI
jgi:hypothetical protein